MARPARSLGGPVAPAHASPLLLAGGLHPEQDADRLAFVDAADGLGQGGRQ